MQPILLQKSLLIGRIPDYPVGHQEMTMIKLLTKPKVQA
jgi:hypothetical protein